jgi:hypothetical protein
VTRRRWPSPPLWDHGHIKFFSVATITALLRDAGFVGLQAHRLGRIPPLAKTTLVVVRKPAETAAMLG